MSNDVAGHQDAGPPEPPSAAQETPKNGIPAQSQGRRDPESPQYAGGNQYVVRNLHALEDWVPILNIDSLLEAWNDIDYILTAAKEVKDSIEFEVRRRMIAEGATVLEHTLEVKLIPASPTYDAGKLHALFELLSMESIGAAYIPEHEVTEIVPASWDGRRLKPLAKYGTAVAQVIEDATIRGPARLSIKRRPLQHEAPSEFR